MTGIIDWEDNRRSGVPDTDFADLWLAAQGEHIGRSTLAVLAGDGDVRIYDDLGVGRPNPLLPTDLVVLLQTVGAIDAGARRDRDLPEPERMTVDAR